MGKYQFTPDADHISAPSQPCQISENQQSIFVKLLPKLQALTDHPLLSCSSFSDDSDKLCH